MFLEVYEKIFLLNPSSSSLTKSLIYRILSITEDEAYVQSPNKQAKVHDLERQIDQMVYELYGLTSEDIAIVEGKK